ncbi:MAG: iron donor protein CyaY [Betaproteobacteria bacterium]|nr:iron donor protein CyaY [Betaproteobacteria bacterium]
MAEDTRFEDLADQTLADIEQAVEACGADVDWELKPGGVLELEFADGSRIIVNRHGAARQIWVAARSGGFHFRPDGGRWVNTRDGADLFETLGRLIGEQSGEDVVLAPPRG